MVVASASARPYAKAAWKLGRDDRDSWQHMLEALKGLARDRRVHTYMANPTLTAADKVQTLMDMCDLHASETQHRFVQVLLRARRFAVLPRIADLYRAMVLQSQQVRLVTVTSARAMSQARQQELRTTLTPRFAGNTLWDFRVEPGLLGGFIARCDDEVIDASVRRRVERLAHSFPGVGLART